MIKQCTGVLVERQRQISAAKNNEQEMENFLF